MGWGRRRLQQMGQMMMQPMQSMNPCPQYRQEVNSQFVGTGVNFNAQGALATNVGFGVGENNFVTHVNDFQNIPQGMNFMTTPSNPTPWNGVGQVQWGRRLLSTARRKLLQMACQPPQQMNYSQVGTGVTNNFGKATNVGTGIGTNNGNGSVTRFSFAPKQQQQPMMQQPMMQQPMQQGGMMGSQANMMGGQQAMYMQQGRRLEDRSREANRLEISEERSS